MGMGFSSQAKWLAAPFYGSRATAAADVNGDRKADGVAFIYDGAYVILSGGTNFSAQSRWMP